MTIKKNTKSIKAASLLRVMGCVGLFFATALLSFLSLYGTEPMEAAITTTKEISVEKGLLPPEISAKSAILFNANTGDILFEKDINEKAYPASTTKILTALITLETVEKYHSDITQKVVIPKEAIGTEGSSIYLSESE